MHMRARRNAAEDRFAGRPAGHAAPGQDARLLHEAIKFAYGVSRSRPVGAGESPTAWRSRALEPSYAMVFIDSMPAKVRERGLLTNRRIHLALGILADGSKDIIGFWIEPERFDALWPSAIDELKRRGVQDILLAVVEDCASCADALRDGFPRVRVQAGIKNLVRSSLALVPTADRPIVEQALARLFGAEGREKVAREFDSILADDVVRAHPQLGSYWRTHWSEASRLFDLPPALRDLVRTTSAVDSLIGKLRRRGIAKRASFASDDAAVSELILVLQDAGATWKVSPNKWIAARPQLARLRHQLRQ